MKISNYNNNEYRNLKFKQAPIKLIEPNQEIGQQVIDNIRNLPKLEKIVKGEAPLYLKMVSNMLKKLAVFTEKNVVQKKQMADNIKKAGTKEKRGSIEPIENLVNIGNIAKELVCMIVYPLQVLTNPDLPKDKRRFVGLYDFYVTCFSLGGTILYAWKGTPAMNKACDKLMTKYTKDISKYPKAARAVKGGAFVVGIALQTILFKRVLAPALSPPLAAKTRRLMEINDKKKEKSANKSSEVLIPPENDAALSVLNSKSLMANSKKDANN